MIVAAKSPKECPCYCGGELVWTGGYTRGSKVVNIYKCDPDCCKTVLELVD